MRAPGGPNLRAIFWELSGLQGLSLLMGKRGASCDGAALKQNLKLGAGPAPGPHKVQEGAPRRWRSWDKLRPVARGDAPTERRPSRSPREPPASRPPAQARNRAGFGAGRRAGRLQAEWAAGASPAAGRAARGAARALEAPGPRPRGSGPPPRAPASPPPRFRRICLLPAAARRARPSPWPTAGAPPASYLRAPTPLPRRPSGAGPEGGSGRGRGGAEAGAGPEGAGARPARVLASSRVGARPGPGAGLVAGSVEAGSGLSHSTESFSTGLHLLPGTVILKQDY